MTRLIAGVFGLMLALLPAVAAAASCVPDGAPRADHPSLLALPDSYWRALPAWADLPAGERDLLARVSIVQRNIRAANARLTFSNEVPRDVVALATAPDERFVADGAPKLDALVTAARAYLRTLDANSAFYVSDGFRSYAVQLETWPRNLRKYLGRIRDQLHPDPGGHYSDDDVCALRAYAGSHYAFPGYSHHQSGRAADFHARLGDTPELNSDSGGGAGGLSNIQRWCKNEIFAWLHVHARAYGFVQAKIDEPWHWVFDPAAAKTSEADRVATSCQH
jgi:hypothetical protein